MRSVLARGLLATAGDRGLILRLFILAVAMTAVYGGTWFVLWSVGRSLPIGPTAIFFGLLIVAFTAAKWVADRPVDPHKALARLAMATGMRVVVPLAGLGLLDLLLEPGFFRAALPLAFAAYFVGLALGTGMTAARQWRDGVAGASRAIAAVGGERPSDRESMPGRGLER